MRKVMLCLGLVACHDLTGQWEGSCGEDEDLGLEVEVVVDDAGELEGDAVMTFDFLGLETSVELELEGTRDRRDFVIELDQSGWKLILEGEKTDGRMEGLCRLYETVGEESILSEGPFELEPTD